MDNTYLLAAATEGSIFDHVLQSGGVVLIVLVVLVL